MKTIVLALALGLVSTDPPANEDTWIWDNNISMVFNQKIVSREVEVIDSEGCKVNVRDDLVGDSQIVVSMKACKRTGYPGGHMIVRYKVNGQEGEYHLHIRHHH